MSEPVYRALKRVLKNRGKKATITVDGYTNFLFLKEDGTPKVGMNYNNMINRVPILPGIVGVAKRLRDPLPAPHGAFHAVADYVAVQVIRYLLL